ncbi:MAG: zinc-dependent peptidase [Flavobacterium sp.]
MIEGVLIGITVIIIAVVVLSLLLVFVEYVYVFIFSKPIYVHFYLKLKKLPHAQLTFLKQHSQYYRRLPLKKQEYFEHRTAEFLANYKFVSRQGALIDNELKVAVASAYITLSFGMRNYLSNSFTTILIYPDSYLSTQKNQMHDGEFSPQYKAVVFSRKALLEGFNNGNDNLNLAIHEFAHVLTYHSIKKRDVSASIFSDQYHNIISKITQPINAEMLKNSNYFRIYAFTNQYEFVAVILEHFFETPQQFERQFPDLFKDVKKMINQ